VLSVVQALDFRVFGNQKAEELQDLKTDPVERRLSNPKL
jgi:hypothetical protein